MAAKMDKSQRLTNASAYLVWKAHKLGKDAQLGKTKLYKMLFMASWRAVRELSYRLYTDPWYRIDKGPALITSDWEALTGALESQYGIQAKQVTMWHGYAQVCFSAPLSSPLKAIAKKSIPFLDKAFEEIIDLSAEDAAAVTYSTDAMLWLIAEERVKWGGSVQYRSFSLEDDDRDKFTALAQEYAKGAIDIPEIARRMGADWSLHQVVIYLDTFGLYRPLKKVALSDRQRNSILRRLASILRQHGELHRATVEERTMASSRIEEEYFAPNSILD